MLAASFSAFALSALLAAAPPSSGQVWEVDLLPGTFHVHCEKLPHLDPARNDAAYFTVAFHTPDNVQFVIVYGMQRPRPPAFKDLLQVAAADGVKLAEVRKIDAANDRTVRVIAPHAQGFTFVLKGKTRVFFAAQSDYWHKVDRCDSNKSCLLPEWSPWRFSVEKRTRTLPLRLLWLPEREVYHLQIECFAGEFDFQDWLITVDYLE